MPGLGSGHARSGRSEFPSILRVPPRDPQGKLSENESTLAPMTWSSDEDLGRDAQPLQPSSTPRIPILTILLLIFIGNQACRALPFYLVDFSRHADPADAINAALGFNSTKYGVFATLGFTLPFMFASLVAGVLADSVDRMCITGIAGLCWSACTLSMAVATSYEALLGQRMLLGMVQAATNPAAFSLIAELFPEARATTSSVFGLGIYIGGGLASLGAELDQALGWRGSCIVFGLLSAAVSMLAFLVSDPRVRTSLGPDVLAGDQHSGMAYVAVSLHRTMHAVPTTMGGICTRTLEALAPTPTRWLLLASALRFCAGFGILVWLPAAMHSRFPRDLGRFAVYNSVIKVFAGSISSLAGGVISDALQKHGFSDRAGAVFCAASCCAAAPLWYLVLGRDFPFEVSMGFLLAEYLVAESWLGPAITTLQASVPPDRRGAVQGVFSSLTALGNALPAALGLLPADSLAHGLQVAVSICYVLSGACFIGAAISISPPREWNEGEWL